MPKTNFNITVFVVAYASLVAPTYWLPKVGSVSDLGLLYTFLLHMTLFVLLVVLCWIRGNQINRLWLIAIPITAMVFNFVPGLNLIPYVSTIIYGSGLLGGIAFLWSK